MNKQYDLRLNVNNLELTHSIELMKVHYRVFENAEKVIGPYNAKQRRFEHYIAPEKEFLYSMIKQDKMNDFTYLAFIRSLVLFCEQNKGMRALPTPHPSVISSLQFPKEAFNIYQQNKDYFLELVGFNNPFKISTIKLPKIQFVILRPVLGKMGTPNVSKWEVLLFKKNYGYIPDWVDSTINPRWSGVF